MKKYDATIIGAGLAGLFLGRDLARKGFSVLLVDRKEDLSKGIHTTGIFVRKTFEDFDFPEGALGRPIADVSLYSPKLRKLDLGSEMPEYRVGRMGFLYDHLLNECIDSGVEFRRGTSYKWAAEKRRSSNLLTSASRNYMSSSVVCLEKAGNKEFVETEVLVGADGCATRVAKDLSLDRNQEWIVGFENVYKLYDRDETPRLHCFLDNELAPGYLAWISNDGEDIHVGVGGYPSRFQPKEALRIFEKSVVPKVLDLSKADYQESRGGRIPVGGVLNRVASPRGVLVGDAAGAVSPLTAGGLDPCLRLSKFAGEVIEARLNSSDPVTLLDFNGSAFRKKFTKRLLMRWGLKTFSSRWSVELGFRFLETGIGKLIADEVFFRRASFPDAKECDLGIRVEKEGIVS